jgi:hypothetical protein
VVDRSSVIAARGCKGIVTGMALASGRLAEMKKVLRATVAGVRAH